MEDITEMLKGVLEGSVLEIISRNSTYGYDITLQLRALGFTGIVEGTVYAILLRLEKSGLVTSEKRPSSGGPPRKIYQLTDLGLEELQSFWAKWDFVSAKINELRSN